MLLLGVLTGVPALAQGSGGAASLGGVVVDAQGGAIPGASVDIKNVATGVSENVVSNVDGAFSVPGLNPGTYSVTVSLQGFKTTVVNNVRLVAATAAEIKVSLEIGALSETVDVKGGVGLVQTTGTAVQATMLSEQIAKLPLSSRNGLSSTMSLPGVQQTGGGGYRTATINGLPQNTISITLDGVGIGNNRQSNDGFYTQVFPRLDAVEEVTVTGATPDAAGGSQGSVQVAFVTRSGTNDFHQSIYHYWRSPELNTNYYFNKINNLPINNVTVHQFGGRIGGPIIRNKAFFFFNYEQFYLPNEATRTRVIIGQAAQQGAFRYDVAGQVREVNVLTLARNNGQAATSSVDPLIANLLTSIRTAAGTTGTITPRTDLNTDQYVFLPDSTRNEYAPTTRLDWNVSKNHRLLATYLWQRIKSEPDFLNSGEAAFPGFPNFTTQSSYRTTGSLGLRSTLSSTMVNDLKGGFQWTPVDFYSDLSADSFANQGGRAVTLGFGLTSATIGNAPNLVNTPSVNIDDTLTWLRGKHSLSFGGSFTRINNSSEAWNVVPTAVLGFDQTNDPAAGIFSTANFPGASTANLTSARALYALLTGRVSAVNATSRLNANGQYEYIGRLEQGLQQTEFGAFAQDQWRVTPGLTLNVGLRWKVAQPFVPTTDTYSTATLSDLCGVSGVGSGPEGRECNLFQPGNLSGNPLPQYTLFDSNSKIYDTEWGRIAPNVGLAWRPMAQGGIPRVILGDPDQGTIRGGYSRSFNTERVDRFTGIYGNNPGGTVSANRNVANGNLVLAGESWPLLLAQNSRLGPPATCGSAVTAACVPAGVTYPISGTVANGLSIFDPNITLPSTDSWSVGFQRALTSDSAVEIVYLGNRNNHAWGAENWNERNLVENNFLTEFSNAQRNLRANIAANRGASFAYFGPNTGTAPLPTYLAYLAGSNAASDPSKYSAAVFASTTWTQFLSQYSPNPLTTATNLDNDPTRRANAAAAGLPANFFVMNPAVASANIMRSAGSSYYNALQLQYRRRLSKGLLVNASYVFSRRYVTSVETIHLPRFELQDEGVPHAFKLNWTYALPFGKGRAFGSDWGGVSNALLGGWELAGTSRIQKEIFSLDTVKLVGMSKAELQDAFSMRIVNDPATGVTTVFDMPQDIIDNTRKAFSIDPTSTTGYSALGAPTGRYIAPASDPSCIALYPGDCGTPKQIVLTGPAFVRFDLRGTKRFTLGNFAIELSFEALNLFDNINFNPSLDPGSAATIFQVTSAYRDTGVDVNDPGGRLGQVVWRVSW